MISRLIRFRKPIQPTTPAISHDITARTIKYGLLIIALIGFATFLLMPDPAFAANTPLGTFSPSVNNLGNNAAACAGASNTAVDWSYCLPIGRWGAQVGNIFSRNEPAGSMLGGVVNAFSTLGTAIRSILPNMFLMLTEVCWNSAYSLTLLAVDFNPLDQMGAYIDNAAGGLAKSVVNGGVLSIFLVLALFAWIAKAITGHINEAGMYLKKAGIILAVFAVMIFTGVQASKSTANNPAKGSPWWTVKIINETINKVTVGVDLTSTSDTDASMSHSNSGEKNCQDYLNAMHEEYKKGKTNDGGTPSSLVLTVNKLWEETALRNWVTMQYGNPTAGAQSSKDEAMNARAAYCHVQEAMNNVSPKIQQNLTNSAYGLKIDDKTAQYLFTTRGFIDPWNGAVTKDVAGAFNRDEDTKLTRMALFWEACDTKGSDKDIFVRDGWHDLFNNLNSSDMKAIRGSLGSYLRAGRDGQGGFGGDKPDENLANLSGDSANKFGGKIENSSQRDSNGVLGACKTVFTDANAFPSTGKITNGNMDVPTADAAAALLGWRFDVPNVGASWSQTKFLVEGSNVKDASKNGGSAGFDFQDSKEQRLATFNTVRHIYGDAKTDTMGALGSVIGGLVSLAVFGLLAFAVLVLKLMLALMPLFFVPALLLQAFPFGSSGSKAMLRWAKDSAGVGLVGLVYSVIGQVACLICNVFLNMFGSMSNGFMYTILAGSSPAMAIATIGLFCKFMHVGNPFSVKGAMSLTTGGGMALAGFQKLKRAAGGVAKGLTRGAVTAFALSKMNKDKGDSVPTRFGNPQKGIDKLNSSVRSQMAATNGAPDTTQRMANVASTAMRAQDDLNIEAQRMLANGGNRVEVEKYRQLKSQQINADRVNGIRRINEDIAHRADNEKFDRRQQLERSVKRAARSVVKLGVAPALMLNPITAPAGIALTAHYAMQTARRTRAAINARQLSKGADAAAKRAWSVVENSPFVPQQAQPAQPADTQPVTQPIPPMTNDPDTNIRNMQKNWTGSPEQKRAYAHEQSIKRMLHDAPDQKPFPKPSNHN